MTMTYLLLLAGLGQIAIAFASLLVPRVLRWQEDTSQLKPLTRQAFWTYAAYIWTINLSMGLLSVLQPQWLLDSSGLARSVTGFIAVYWGARVAIQFTYFDTGSAPSGPLVRLGNVAMDCAFVYLTLVYLALTLGVR